MTQPPPGFVSEPFGDHHDVSAFDCGKPLLTDWLQKSARDSDGRRITRTWVWTRRDNDVVIGYFSLMPYTIERGTLAGRQARGLPDSIPCYLLARLALTDDPDLRGTQTGTHLLADAVTRATAAAQSVGGRLIVVDAIDEEAASFYMHHNFEPIASDPDRLVIRVKTAAARIAHRG